MLDLTMTPGRTCGGCSACCKTYEVKELQKPWATWCQHCLVGGGCAIYETRPERCRDYRCEWLKGFGKEWERPDKTGVVLDYVKDPEMPGGQVFQMFEFNEGALEEKYTANIAKEVLLASIFVYYVYLSGRKRLFYPHLKLLTPEIRDSALEDGFEICSLYEL